jgi:hypothetical protein
MNNTLVEHQMMTDILKRSVQPIIDIWLKSPLRDDPRDELVWSETFKTWIVRGHHFFNINDAKRYLGQQRAHDQRELEKKLRRTQ